MQETLGELLRISDRLLDERVEPDQVPGLRARRQQLTAVRAALEVRSSCPLAAIASFGGISWGPHQKLAFEPSLQFQQYGQQYKDTHCSSSKQPVCSESWRWHLDLVSAAVCYRHQEMIQAPVKSSRGPCVHGQGGGAPVQQPQPATQSGCAHAVQSPPPSTQCGCAHAMPSPQPSGPSTPSGCAHAMQSQQPVTQSGCPHAMQSPQPSTQCSCAHAMQSPQPDQEPHLPGTSAPQHPVGQRQPHSRRKAARPARVGGAKQVA